MNSMTPQPAVAAALTRWWYPTFKASKKVSWVTKKQKNSHITFSSVRVWLLKTAEWRTRTSKFPVQLRWARAHECDSGLPDDRWTRSSENKQMFWDPDLISSTDPTPHALSYVKIARGKREWELKQKEREGEKERGSKTGSLSFKKKRQVSKGRECQRKWEWVTQWGVGEWGERKEKELREGEGECFYPHVHSVRGVSECDCSWSACQNSVATTAPIHLRPTLKCVHTQTHTSTLTYASANAWSLQNLFTMLLLKP